MTTEAFVGERPSLFGLAYRMLGSVAEAEDILQEAFLRWQGANHAEVKNVRAFLRKIVTRLCLDHLKSARARREHYVGAWLPEPLIEESPAPDDLAQDLSFALLLALECLSPLERAVFLLHDIFETDFAEIAALLGRSEAACRQLAARARANLGRQRPRFSVPAEQARAFATAFDKASREGDLAVLHALLAQDVVLYTDGGGRRAAALNPIFGRDKVCRFYRGLLRKGLTAPPLTRRFGWVNGQPGLVTLEWDGLPQAIGLEIEDSAIRALYVIRNPEKLQHIAVGETNDD